MSGILQTLQDSTPQEIESFCNLRFQHNLTFFQTHYPELFKAIQTKAKQFQLYIGKEGVNILDFTQNVFMFPVENGKSLMLEIHTDCAKNPPANPKWQRIFGSKTYKMPDEFIYSKMLINGIVDYAFENGGTDFYHLPSNFLPSLNLFGLGGGIFLQMLIEQYSFIHNFFIFEESLDLFRIACFFVDFALLFSKTLDGAGYLFIQNLMQRSYVNDFFLKRKISTSVVRFELIFYKTPLTQNARDIMYEMHAQSLRGWGSFEDEMRGILNKISTPITSMLTEVKRVNAPICVIANGPSLDGLLPFIKENANNMILFSCGTALKPLLNYGITPDFQIEIERHHYLGDVLKSAPLGAIPLLCASVLDKSAKEVAKEIYLFEREGSSAANFNDPKLKIQFTAPLVGNAGAALACYLGSDVLLCGLDCGYKKGYSKHAQNSYYGDEKVEIPEGAYGVVGNFSDDIYSDALFSFSRMALEEAFRSLKPHHILNLSDGAKIEGAQPVRAEEFVLKNIDKKRALRQIKSLFKDPYKVHFYAKETQKYQIEILVFRNKLLDIFKKQVKTKESLFIMVDYICDFIDKEANKNPFIGILFGGTMMHFLYAVVLAGLHLPNDDMQHLWEKAQSLYKNAMGEMIQYLHTTLFSKVEH